MIGLGWIIIIGVTLGLLIKTKQRKYFWKDREGKELSLKEFKDRFKDGVVNITPIQQTKTTLWSFIPLFAGLTWGIVATALLKTYWLTLILCGSLPITTIQFISNLQKYKAQKNIADAMKQIEDDMAKQKKKKVKIK